MANSIRESFRFRTLSTLMLGLSTATGSTFTIAQTAVLEEVIVVAQKREENMMDVPVAQSLPMVRSSLLPPRHAPSAVAFGFPTS